jgi:hypothetical protein
MLGMKVLCDNTYSNRSWENLSGIPLRQLNLQEIKFLEFLNFDLMISQTEYFQWMKTIEKQVSDFRIRQFSDCIFAPLGRNHSRRRSLTVSPYI